MKRCILCGHGVFPNSEWEHLHSKHKEIIMRYQNFDLPRETVCKKCNTVFTAQTDLSNKGALFVPAYCHKCMRKNPLFQIVVKEVVGIRSLFYKKLPKPKQGRGK